PRTSRMDARSAPRGYAARPAGHAGQLPRTATLWSRCSLRRLQCSQGLVYGALQVFVRRAPADPVASEPDASPVDAAGPQTPVRLQRVIHDELETVLRGTRVPLDSLRCDVRGFRVEVRQELAEYLDDGGRVGGGRVAGVRHRPSRRARTSLPQRPGASRP